MMLLLFLLCIVQCYSFVTNTNRYMYRSPVTLNAVSIQPPSKKSFLEELRDIFFGAIPEALAGNESQKVNVLNYANIKEGSFSKHKPNSKWKNDDIIANFAKHYIPDYEKGSNTLKLFQKLEDLEEHELLESLDEYMNVIHAEKEFDPLTASEMFIGESLQYAVAPIDHAINTEKLRKEPKRFFKPVKSSVLTKVLAKDPFYFNH